jgi:GSCFA family protein
MSVHPYRNLPNYAFWRRSIAECSIQDVDPVVQASFKLARTDRIATAGSCFAQHIARHLRQAGFGILVTETGHPIVPSEVAEEHGYGLFTARYGNIYTSRQLLQLFQRAYGNFVPAEDVWQETDGKITDPFRPQIQPGRFLTLAEYRADREHHFKCVREAFETLDVFIFTLGLTESWQSRIDGAVYPLCPGVAGGTFDEQRHEFVNFSATEVTSDLTAFRCLLRGVNPSAQILLTVSPVPLIATIEPRHVLVSTTYSKSVLRVAAAQAVSAHDNVSYFPSYEIIAGSFSRGAYFAADCRSITETGIQHVMRTFMRHYTDAGPEVSAEISPTLPDAHTDTMARLVRVVCDEEALDRIA